MSTAQMSSVADDPDKIGLVNMLRYAKAIKRAARQSIKGNVVQAVLAGIVTAIAFDIGLFELFSFWQWSVGIICTYVLVIGPLEVGATRYFYLKTLSDRTNSEIVDNSEISVWKALGFAFSSDRYMNIVLAMALRSIVIAVCSLMLIIPGVIAGLRLSAVPYLLAVNPGLKTLEALKISNGEMIGHCEDLFVLKLSFIFWWLGSIFTGGLLRVVLMPYLCFSQTHFLLNLPLVDTLQSQMALQPIEEPLKTRPTAAWATLIVSLVLILTVLAPQVIVDLREYHRNQEAVILADLVREHLQDKEPELIASMGDQLDLDPVSAILNGNEYLVDNNLWDKEERWFIVWDAYGSGKVMYIGLQDGLIRFKSATVYVFDRNSGFTEYPLTDSKN